MKGQFQGNDRALFTTSQPLTASSPASAKARCSSLTCLTLRAVRYSEAKHDAVAALLDEFGVALIEDEPYRELTFDGGRARPIASRLRKASWIYTDPALPGLGRLASAPGWIILLADLETTSGHPHLIGSSAGAGRGVHAR